MHGYPTDLNKCAVKQFENVYSTEPKAAVRKSNGRLFQEDGQTHEKAQWA